MQDKDYVSRSSLLLLLVVVLAAQQALRRSGDAGFSSCTSHFFRPRSRRSPGNHRRCPGPPRTSPGSLPRKTAPRGPCTSGRRRRASCNSTWGCLTVQQCKNASLHKNILQVPHLLPRAAASSWAASAAARAVSPQVQKAHVLIFLEKVLGADAALANFAGDLAGIAPQFARHSAPPKPRPQIALQNLSRCMRIV